MFRLVVNTPIMTEETTTPAPEQTTTPAPAEPVATP